jgi:hypothetical protein
MLKTNKMRNNIETPKTKHARKLQTALIEQGKEVEKMNYTPDQEAFDLTLKNLKFAIQNNDMEDQRLYGRKLCAQVTKFMLDKL